MRGELDLNPGPVESSYRGGLVKVVVESFGYLHGPAPRADITVDLRDLLRNPDQDPQLRELTGLDPVIRDRVLSTPGAREILLSTARLAETVLRLRDPGLWLTRVAFGCAGGRHRSVVLANELTNMFLQVGVGAEVSHRDILRPVVRPHPEVGA
jgi:UPF0042 nucleotide-binding protein